MRLFYRNGPIARLRPVVLAAWSACLLAAACIDREPTSDPATFTLTSPGAGGRQVFGGVGSKDPAPAAGGAQAPLATLPIDTSVAALLSSNSSVMTPIVGLDPDVCLDLPSGKPAEGAEVHAFNCLGPASGRQSWVLDNGRLVIGGVYCLALAPGAPTGSRPSVASCLADQAQARRAQQLWGYDRGMLILEGTQMCLSIARESPIANEPLALAACDAKSSLQQWYLANVAVPASGKATTIGLVTYLRRSPNVCLDVFAGHNDVGTSIGLFKCTGGSPQRLSMQGSQLQFASKCVGVSGSNPAGGSSLELQVCASAAPGQSWALHEGQIQLAGSSPLLCMCTPPGATVDMDAIPLQLSSCEANSIPSEECLWSLGKL